MTKKIIALALVLLMLVPMIMACDELDDLPDTDQKLENEKGNSDEKEKDPDKKPDEGKKPGKEPVVPDPVVPEPVVPDTFYDRIPTGDALDALGFAGSTVNVLTWEEEEAQTFPKEDSTEDPIKSKLYYHWKGIEERLDIKFETTWIRASMAYRVEFFTEARADHVNYDLIQTQSLYPAVLATEGHLCNLKALQFPDLSKNDNGDMMMPWWPNSIDDWTQNDALYFIASNSSAQGISNMSVVFVHDGIITSKGAASPVESVIRGLWTVEEMTNISKLFAGAAESATPENRYYGVVVDLYSSLSALYYSIGFSSVAKNSDGVAELCYDEESELGAITNALNQFEALVTGAEAIIGRNSNDNYASLMYDGRCAMLLGYMQYIRQLEKTETYTVIPLPMLETNQYDPNVESKGYRTVHRDYMDVWCISTKTDNKMLSGIILEANAAAEYYSIAPFYYETYLKDRYANGPDGRACFDILRHSVAFDFGRVLQLQGVTIEGKWNGCFTANGFKNTFSDDVKGTLESIRYNFEHVLTQYKKYQNN